MQRESEVKKNQKLYEWGTDPTYSQDLPGFVMADGPENLPKDVQFTSVACYSLFNSGIRGFINLGLNQFFEDFQSWDSFEDFKKCLLGPLPSAAERWKDDTWVGNQFQNGSNPEVLRRCKALPGKFRVTNEMVSKQLERGFTLEQEMQVKLNLSAQ